MSSVDLCNSGVICKKATVSVDEVVALVENNYGLIVTNVQELNGYDDRNFKLETKQTTTNKYIKDLWSPGYVLKVINSEDSKNVKLIEAQNSLMLHLDKHNINVPLPVFNKSGKWFSLEALETPPDNTLFAIKLLTFQPGCVLNDDKPSSQLYKNVGTFLAEINTALENFQHEAYNSYQTSWDLGNVPEIRKYFYLVEDKQQLALIEQHVENFEKQVLPLISSLESGMIHGDFNEHNILTDGNGNIRALLDFGDAHYAPYLFELAICICYMLIHSKDISCVQDIIGGYLKRRKLTDLEASLLKMCVCARLCQSLVLGLHSYQIYKNIYVLSSSKSGWTLLKELTDCDDTKLKVIWKLEY